MPEDDKLLGYLRRVTADLHHTRNRHKATPRN